MTVTPLLIELPNGDWVRSDRICGIRMMNDKELGARIAIDTQHDGTFLFRLDDVDAARAWVKKIVQACSAAPA